MNKTKIEVPSEKDFDRYQAMVGEIGKVMADMMEEADDPIRVMELAMACSLRIHSQATGIPALSLLDASDLNIREYLLQHEEQ